MVAASRTGGLACVKSFPYLCTSTCSSFRIHYLHNAPAVQRCTNAIAQLYTGGDRRCIRCIRCISLHLCNTPLPLVFYIFLGLTRCQYTEGFALKNWRSSHMHLMHLMHLRCKGAKVQRCEAGVKKLAKVVHQRCKKQAVWASLHPLPPHHLSCTCGAHSPVLWCIWKLLHTVTLLLCTFGARITITMHLWCKGVCIKEV